MLDLPWIQVVVEARADEGVDTLLFLVYIPLEATNADLTPCLLLHACGCSTIEPQLCGWRVGIRVGAPLFPVCAERKGRMYVQLEGA